MSSLHFFLLSAFKRIAPRMGCASLIDMLDVRLSLDADGDEGGDGLRLRLDMRVESGW